MLEERLGAYYSVSCTTRPKRPGEVDGRDYTFVSPQQFRKMVEDEHFLEWEEVHDNLYGTPKGPIDERRKRSQLVVLDVDVKGALAVKRRLPEAVLVFIMPPSWEELERRLVARGKDSPEVIEKRLINARKEGESKDAYDVVVENRVLEDTYAEIEKIIRERTEKSMKLAAPTK
jgi:guanylate kinase